MSKKIRLGIVTSVIDNRSAKGTAYVARKLLEFLPRYQDQFDITLIHREKTNDPLYTTWPELVMPRITFPFATQLIQETLFWIIQRLKRNRFDVVHYMQPRVWPSYMLAPAKKIVITMHEAGIMLDLHHISLGDRLFRFTNKHLHQRMDAVIAVSEYGKKEIRKYCHIAQEKIEVIPNALSESMHEIEVTPDLIDSLEKKFGIKHPYILSVGRLDPHKNILRLLEAYHLFRKQGGIEYLVLVGGKHMPEYSKLVEEKIKNLELETTVIITPFIPDSDLSSVYSAARALIYPSLHEGFGLPILEAFACGIPVACSNTTSLPEIGSTAVLQFNPYNIQCIANAMRTVTHDDEFRNDLIKKGRNRLERFSWQRSAHILFALYKNIMKK